MNDPWLFGQSLRKNRSKALPVRFKYFNPSLDGLDDFISIDNSQNVGNPYSFDRTNPFTLAQIITPKITSLINFSMFDKRTSNAGYFFGINASSQMFASFNTPSGQRGALLSSGLGFGNNIKTIWIISFSGNSDASGFTIRQYNGGTGALTQAATIANGDASILGGVTGVMTGTLTNTTPLNIGKNFVGGATTKAIIERPSIWNIELNSTQAQDLANRMIADTVKDMTIYPSNCVGYWRNATDQTYLNEVNTTYNGTLNGFNF